MYVNGLGRKRLSIINVKSGTGDIPGSGMRARQQQGEAGNGFG